jgi:hypothetical protein
VKDGLIEVGVCRMRTAGGESLDPGAYMREGFVRAEGVDVPAQVAAGRP